MLILPVIDNLKTYSGSQRCACFVVDNVELSGVLILSRRTVELSGALILSSLAVRLLCQA